MSEECTGRKWAAEQAFQENEYSFPYHYVAQYDAAFRHFYLDTWSINYVSTIEYLLEKVGEVPHGRIVDIGCGDGRFSREMALAFPDATVVGVDYSKRAIALASAMNPEIANLRFMSIDITQPHDLDRFDLAVLMEVFEHVPLAESEAFLAGTRALLKEGGMLLLTVPHENKPLEYKHFQHFNEKRVVAYLTPLFDVVEVVPFEKISWMRSVMKKVLSNRLFILSNPVLLRAIYSFYKKKLFFCDSESRCQRLFVAARAK